MQQRYLETTKFNKLPSTIKIELDKKMRLILWGVLVDNFNNLIFTI